MSSNCSEISAELSLGLVSPEHTIVPLMAELSYSCARNPYAVRMAFDVGTDEPVEWIMARDLLAAALHGSEGLGDVRAWPSAASCDPGVAAVGSGAAGHAILNIAMTSPYGQAQFEGQRHGDRELLAVDQPAGGDRAGVVVPELRRRADRAAQPSVRPRGADFSRSADMLG